MYCTEVPTRSPSRNATHSSRFTRPSNVELSRSRRRRRPASVSESPSRSCCSISEHGTGDSRLTTRNVRHTHPSSRSTPADILRVLYRTSPSIHTCPGVCPGVCFPSDRHGESVEAVDNIFPHFPRSANVYYLLISANVIRTNVSYSPALQSMSILGLRIKKRPTHGLEPYSIGHWHLCHSDIPRMCEHWKFAQCSSRDALPIHASIRAQAQG